MYGRERIRKAKRVANPGCYATSTQMLLAPLVSHMNSHAMPSVFGISGYSGAGTVASTNSEGEPISLPKVTPESLRGGVKPYSLTDHIHEREAGFHLSSLLSTNAMGMKVAFVPSVGTWFSGILTTASVPLNGRFTARQIGELFEKKYEGERMVRFSKGVPELRDVEGKHGWVCGGFQVHSDGERVVVVGGLDNLLKGAATQCLQVRSFFGR